MHLDIFLLTLTITYLTLPKSWHLHHKSLVPYQSPQASALAWRHFFFSVSQLSPFHIPLPPGSHNHTESIMGVDVDSERAYSPSTPHRMIRLERREAKRRMVALSLLACFLFLAFVALRPANTFRREHTLQPANSTASSLSRTNVKAKSWFKGRPKSRGPVLSDGQRSLSHSSLADLNNASLGVRQVREG